MSGRLCFVSGRDFYPRPPRGGRRASSFLRFSRCRISIHALREEGDGGKIAPVPRYFISIHALREEGDQTASKHRYRVITFLSTPSARRATLLRSPRYRNSYISIHALREEGDCYTPFSLAPVQLFLSTPSARRATVSRQEPYNLYLNFYPRPPRGGRLPQVSFSSSTHSISIHALREEGDLSVALLPGCPILFLSTPSARRATLSLPVWHSGTIFLSTPSARRATETDYAAQKKLQNFYPRPPRGGRRGFQAASRRQDMISIHALREEGDCLDSKMRPHLEYFYPRPPRGGRRLAAYRSKKPAPISIHAIREEGDRRQPGKRHTRRQFLSTPSARRATALQGLC